MTRRRYEVNCLYIGGVPGITIKISTDTTLAFIAHMRSHYQGSFSIIFNAGVDSDWAYDSCTSAGLAFEAAVQSFDPPA